MKPIGEGFLLDDGGGGGGYAHRKGEGGLYCLNIRWARLNLK